MQNSMQNKFPKYIGQSSENMTDWGWHFQHNCCIMPLEKLFLVKKLITDIEKRRFSSVLLS